MHKLLVSMALVVSVAGGAGGQERTVMYKDWQQTVTVPHVFTPDVIGPPFTVEGKAFGVPATGLAPDMIGASTTAGLGAATTAGKVRTLSDGGATGGVVMSDGTAWRCGEEKTLKVAVVTCPPYNAKGDGVTDDADAIQAAITASKSVYFPAGTYLVTGGTDLSYQVAFAVPAGRTLKGAGVGVTMIKLANGGDAHLVSIADVNDVTISDMTLDGNQANQTLLVNGIRVLGSSRVRILNVNVVNPRGYGIGIGGTATNGANDVYIENVRLEGCGADCLNYHDNVPGKPVRRMFVNNLTVVNPVVNEVAGAGIDVRGIVELNNIHVTDVRAGMWAISLRNAILSGEGGAAFSSLNNFYVQGAAGGGSMGVRLFSSYTNVSNGFILGFDDGVAALAALPSEGFIAGQYNNITNVISAGAARQGFYFDVDTMDQTCTGCVAIEGFEGIDLRGDRISIIGGAVRNNTSQGLLVQIGAEDAVISGTTILNNGVGPDGVEGTNLLSLGPRLQMYGIKGMVMQNSGTTFINTGSTSTVVTHGLWFTPYARQIHITPTNNQGAAVKWWISNMTATTFTLNVDTDPATPAQYSWSAAWQ